MISCKLNRDYILELEIFVLWYSDIIAGYIGSFYLAGMIGGMDHSGQQCYCDPEPGFVMCIQVLNYGTGIHGTLGLFLNPGTISQDLGWLGGYTGN